jgi:hypothetical protein
MGDEHLSFVKKCLRRGFRIWVFGIVVLLPVSLLSGHFQWNTMLTGCMPMAFFIPYRLVIRNWPLIRGDDPIYTNNPGALFHTKLFFLVQDGISIFFLLVSFSPLLLAFYLLQGKF